MIITEIAFAVGIAFGYVPYLAYAVKCCETVGRGPRSTLQRSNLNCHNSADDFQFCILCRNGPCLFLGIPMDPISAAGVTKLLKDSIALLEPACTHYEKTFGGLLVLEGDICLCNNKDFCNKQYWDEMWQTNSGGSPHRNVFVVSAVSVFGLAFFCILCVQHSCICSLGCCDSDEEDKV